MKTLKRIFILGIVLAFAVNSINAQPPVVKLEVFFDPGGQIIHCTGDKIAAGSVIPVEIMIMQNNVVAKVHKAVVTGIPSGKEYEISQVMHDGRNWSNHLEYRLEGKLVAIVQIVYHITVNANDEITVEFNHGEIMCK